MLAFIGEAYADDKVGSPKQAVPVQHVLFSGSCIELILGDLDFSEHCSSALVQYAYGKDELGFQFFMNGKASVSFVGRDTENIGDDKDRTILYIMFFDLGIEGVGVSHDEIEGICDYGNPALTGMTISCGGRSSAFGNLSAVFRSDGGIPLNLRIFQSGGE